MNIILHIGQSKTGTTALQSVLSANRDVLQQKGILYPDVFLKGISTGIINHNAFANSLLGFDFYPRLSADEYWEQFTQQYQAGNYHTLLLSAESFFGGRPYLWELDTPDDYWVNYKNKLEVLKKYIGQSSTKIISYLRPQDKWFESIIPQIIRYEGTLGKKVYHSDEQLMMLQQPRMDYARLISLWDEIIMPDSFQINAYNPKNFPEGSTILDFLKYIDIKASELKEVRNPSNPHVSWSSEFIEVKKKLNLTSRSRSSEDTIIDIINKLDKKMGSRQKYVISDELRIAIYKNVKEGNAYLADKYCNGKLFETPFKGKTSNRSLEKETFQQDISVAMRAFEKQYNSTSGKISLLGNSIKRLLRKRLPAIHAFLAHIWRNFKYRTTTSAV